MMLNGIAMTDLEKGKRIFVPRGKRSQAYYRFDPRPTADEGLPPDPSVIRTGGIVTIHGPMYRGKTPKLLRLDVYRKENQYYWVGASGTAYGKIRSTIYSLGKFDKNSGVIVRNNHSDKPFMRIQAITHNGDSHDIGPVESVAATDFRKERSVTVDALVEDIKNKFNLKEIHALGDSDKKQQTQLEVVEKQLKRIQERLGVCDGKNQLTVEIGNVIGGRVLARYFSTDVLLKVSSKYQDSLAHEYGHYIWWESIFAGTYKKPFRKILKDQDVSLQFTMKLGIKGDLLEKKLNGYVDELVFKLGYGVTPQMEAYVELMHGLNNWYVKQIEKADKQIGDIPKTLTAKNEEAIASNLSIHWNRSTPVRKAYLLDQGEIFARAINNYVHNAWNNPFYQYSGFNEGDPEYKKIVSEWVDKYVKTGIVKALEIPQTAARLVVVETEHGPYESWAAFPTKTRPIRSRGSQTKVEEKEEDELDARVDAQMDETWELIENITKSIIRGHYATMRGKRVWVQEYSTSRSRRGPRGSVSFYHRESLANKILKVLDSLLKDIGIWKASGNLTGEQRKHIHQELKKIEPQVKLIRKRRALSQITEILSRIYVELGEQRKHKRLDMNVIRMTPEEIKIAEVITGKEIEKSQQVRVKPHQRKGKYVIGYHRFDPRSKPFRWKNVDEWASDIEALQVKLGLKQAMDEFLRTDPEQRRKIQELETWLKEGGPPPWRQTKWSLTPGTDEEESKLEAEALTRARRSTGIYKEELDEPWKHKGFTDIARERGKAIDNLDDALAVWREYKSIRFEKPDFKNKEMRKRIEEEVLHKQYLREIVESYLGADEKAMTLDEIEAEFTKQLDKQVKEWLDKPIRVDVAFKVESKPIEEIEAKYRFKTIEIYTDQHNTQDVAKYLSKEFEKLEGKMEVDGMGLLTLHVANIDVQQNAMATYDADNATMTLDKRFNYTLAHEYAHFIYDRKMEELYPGAKPGFYLDRRIRYRIDNLAEVAGIGPVIGEIHPFTVEERKQAIQKGFDKYIADISKQAITTQSKAYIELMTNLGKFYADNSFKFDAMEWWRKPAYSSMAGWMGDPLAFRVQELNYMLEPTEIFARAVEWYVEGIHLAHFSAVELDDEYHRIVHEWGDKYLKTGIVKSMFVILEKGKRNEPFFNYGELAKDRWYDLIKEAMDTFNVHFDLENNDPVGEGRVITIPQKQWEFSKCKFKCQMWSAGGDWQYPVKYFKCQLIDGYAWELTQYGEKAGMFIFIPGKKQGNFHLVKPKIGSDHWVAPDNNDYKEGIDPKPNERKCWEALKEYLTGLVQKEVEKIREQQKEPVGETLGKSLFVVLEKSEVHVKPYQRKGKYVIGYERFDPREKHMRIEDVLPVYNKQKLVKKIFKVTDAVGNVIYQEAYSTFDAVQRVKPFFTLKSTPTAKEIREREIPKGAEIKFILLGNEGVSHLAEEPLLYENLELKEKEDRVRALQEVRVQRWEVQEKLPPGDEKAAAYAEWKEAVREKRKAVVERDALIKKLHRAAMKKRWKAAHVETLKRQAKERRVKKKQQAAIYQKVEKLKPGQLKLWPEQKGKTPTDTLKQLFVYGEVESTNKLGGGCCETKLVTIKDDGKGVLKPASGEAKNIRSGIKEGTYYLREALTYEIAKTVGLEQIVPETYIRQDQKASIQKFVENIDEMGWNVKLEDEDESVVTDAALFDFIIGNTDRHGGNWLKDGDGNIWLIDNGLVLSVVKREWRSEFFEHCIDNRLSIPEETINRFKKNWDVIEGLCQAFGIEKAAVANAKERFRLATKIVAEGGNFRDLDRVFNEWRHNK